MSASATVYCARCTPQERLVDGECPRCTWMPPATGRRDRKANSGGGAKEHDGDCEFRLGAERCPMPGTFSSNIRGGGPWYCREHSDEGRRRDAERQMRFFRFLRNPDSRGRLLEKWYPASMRRRAVLAEIDRAAAATRADAHAQAAQLVAKSDKLREFEFWLAE